VVSVSRRRIATLVLLGACAGNRRATTTQDAGLGLRSGEAAVPVMVAEVPVVRTAQPAPPVPGGSAAAGSVMAVKVQWTDVPATVRAAPAVDECARAHRSGVRVHTLWGVADAVVMVQPDAAAGHAASPGVAAESPLVIAEPCGLHPSTSIVDAAAPFTVYSTDPRARRLALVPLGQLDQAAAVKWPVATTGPAIALLQQGHEVAVTVPAPGVYALVAPGTDPAWMVATHRQLAAVTDDEGKTAFAGLPPGTYRVTAWLPPTAGSAGKVVTRPLELGAGANPELVIDFGAGGRDDDSSAGTSP
jgi:hypothetical protein